MVWAFHTVGAGGVCEPCDRRSSVRSEIGRSLEVLSYVYVDCAGQADGTSVWRNRPPRLLVDPTAGRIPRIVDVSRLRHVGGLSGRPLHVRPVSLAVLLPGDFRFVAA